MGDLTVEDINWLLTQINHILGWSNTTTLAIKEE
jgi:hypothetical protein